MKAKTSKQVTVKRVGAGAVGSRWRYAGARCVALWRQLLGARVPMAAGDKASLAEFTRLDSRFRGLFKMPMALRQAAASPAAASPAGGAMAAAMAAAGVNVSPARRAAGVECQDIGALLAGQESAAGPLFQAIQAAQDLSLCERFASRFNRKMVGDGRESLWLRDEGRGAGWAVTMSDAIRDGFAAVARWRAGQSLIRDESGADVLSVGDEFGNVGGSWIKSTRAAVVDIAGESIEQAINGYCGGDWRGAVVVDEFGNESRAAVVVKNKYKLGQTAARIAWRAIVDSVAADTLGDSIQQQAFARDYYEWAISGNGNPSGARDRRGLSPAQRLARRLASVQSMQDKLAAGRGKSKAFAAKVGQTAILLLNGTLADAAAAAAGFKGSAARGSKGGASSPSNRLADGLRRRGLRIVSKRGAFAQDLDEHEQAARRGGAAVDLKTLYVPSVVKTSAPVVVPGGVPLPRGHVLPSHVSATSARVVGLHPLSKASSGLPSGSAASASVELSSLPALPAQLRRVVAAGNRRKLQGVLRPKSARGVSSVGDGGAAARVAAFVNADELGAAMVARVAAGAAGAAAARQAARQAAAAGLSDSVELRRVWVSGFGSSYEGASSAGWFNYRSKWADVRGKLVYVGTFQSGFVCRG